MQEVNLKLQFEGLHHVDVMNVKQKINSTFGSISTYIGCSIIEDEPKTESAIESKRASILIEADRLVNKERPGNYGPVNISFDAAGKILEEMLTQDEWMAMKESEAIPGSVIIKAQIATKLVRNSYSPGNRDHRVDIAGYTELLDQYYEARRAASRS